MFSLGVLLAMCTGFMVKRRTKDIDREMNETDQKKFTAIDMKVNTVSGTEKNKKQCDTCDIN